MEANNITREQVDCIVQAINADDTMNQQVWEALAASYGGDQSKASGHDYQDRHDLCRRLKGLKLVVEPSLAPRPTVT